MERSVGGGFKIQPDQADAGLLKILLDATLRSNGSLTASHSSSLFSFIHLHLVVLNQQEGVERQSCRSRSGVTDGRQPASRSAGGLRCGGSF